MFLRRVLHKGAFAMGAAALLTRNYSHTDAQVSNPVINEAAKKNRYDGIVIMPGSTGKQMSSEISNILGCPTVGVNTKRFTDGETLVVLKESVRGKHIFVVQTCAAPLSDHIIELLQMVACAKTCGADRVTAIIPYFGYLYHRRGLPLSSTSQSRFIWSAAFDFAKLLQVVGVDCVVSIDLQRPGQGHEACFFDNMIPVESVYSGNTMAKYFLKNVDLSNTGFSSEKGDAGTKNKIAVVSATPQCVKKTRRFQKFFKQELQKEVGFAVYVQDDITEYTQHVNGHAATPTVASTEGMSITGSNTMLIGNTQGTRISQILGDVKDCDVVVVDEVVDTGGTLSTLCRQLKKEGAKRIFVCASHGLFSNNSMELIDLSPVDAVLVTDSVPLPPNPSPKIRAIPMAPMLAQIIESNLIAIDDAAEDKESYGDLIGESEDLELD